VISRDDRKRVELGAKLAGLDQEFTTWLNSSEKGQRLEKHHSQIRALIGSLQVPVEHLRNRIAASDGPVTWTSVEQELLRIHAVWDLFRQKFALRDVEVFRPYLDLADDFTWACYQPAQRLGAGPHNVPLEEVREPPLTFLGHVFAPFAIQRGSSYATGVGAVVMGDADLRGAVERLPIPLVAVPWFQLRHLPDALVLAHEVGHHVENDFGLTPTLHQLAHAALTSAPALRERQWQGWLGEVFADIYGTLAAGPAFGQTLADFAATGPAATAGTAEYPPVRLRIRCVAETLGQVFSALKDDLLARWAADFPAEPASSYDEDAALLVPSLVTGPYPEFGDVGLTDVIGFASWSATAEDTGTALLKNAQLSAAIDVRCLLAAAGLAFVRNPKRYQANDATDAVLAHAQRIAAKGLRATREQRQFPARDKAAGQSLLALLAAEIPPDDPADEEGITD
jgi:hypothetical protein